MTDTGEALVYVAPQRAELQEVPLPAMEPGMVEVRTTHSALSRGTERLVFEGRVPESEWERMRAPFQEGAFPFPVRYGYAAAGIVEAGPEAMLGRRVFALHPHQTRFRLPAGAVVAIPDAVPSGRAVLAANAETALNGIWDADLSPGESVLVVGAGLLGCLIAAFLARRDDLSVTVSDVIVQRGNILSDFPVTFLPPEEVPPGFDVAFHTSASDAGLATALGALGFEGRAIELSWYGDRPVRVALGAAFHSQRLTIRSSQVGHVAPSRRASTSRRDRLEMALSGLDDGRIDAFLTGEVAFAELPTALARLLAPEADGIATRIIYD